MGECVVSFQGRVREHGATTAFLLRTRRVHLEESGVQEQVQHFFLPGSLRVGITAQRAQQLSAGPEAGSVVGAKWGQEERRAKVRYCQGKPPDAFPVPCCPAHGWGHKGELLPVVA